MHTSCSNLGSSSVSILLALFLSCSIHIAQCLGSFSFARKSRQTSMKR